MRIQETLSNCCQSMGTFATSAAQWLGRTVTAIGSYAASFCSKVAQFVQPYFASLGTFIKNNQTSVIIATIGVAIGAVACAAVSSLCKPSGSNNSNSDLAAFKDLLANKPKKKEAFEAFKALSKDAQKAVRKQFVKAQNPQNTDRKAVDKEIKAQAHKKPVLKAVSAALKAEAKAAKKAAEKAAKKAAHA